MNHRLHVKIKLVVASKQPMERFRDDTAPLFLLFCICSLFGDHIGISVDSGYAPTGLSVGTEIALWSVDPQREAGYLTDAVVLNVRHDENSQSTYLALRISDQSTAVVLQQAAMGAIRVVIHT